MTETEAPKAGARPQIFRGWIAAPREAADRLRDLGLKLGPYSPSQQQFENCEATNEALERLDPLFGQFIYFFEEIRDQTLTVSITGATVTEIEEALRTLSKHVRHQPEGDWKFRLQNHVDMTWQMRPAGGSGEVPGDVQ